jgi:hypothetical protein
MPKKKNQPESMRDGLLNADKPRDFERIAHSHPRWLRQKSGKGDHHIEFYRMPDDTGEARIAWDPKLSIGVRRNFVRRLVELGLLLFVITLCGLVFIILLHGG